jgi:hypothetical protein
MPFTPASTGTVTEIDLPLAEDLGGSFAATLTIYADAFGLPGALLASFVATGLPGWDHRFPPCVLGDPCTVYRTGTPAVPLTAGVSYWLSVAPIGSTVIDDWWANDTGVSAVSYYGDRMGHWTNTNIAQLAAFELVSVPEPRVSYLMLVGLLIFLAVRKIPHPTKNHRT